MDGLSRISEEQVKHVAHLARLAITEEEAQRFTKQLDAIISFGEQLAEVNTDGVEPMSHVLAMKNVMRDDTPKESLPVEEVLKNAPERDGNQFKVPLVLE